MGSYAEIEKCGNVPEDKYDEFEEKMLILLRESGMMVRDCQYMFDRWIVTLSQPKMSGLAADVTFNYFEDDSWENAGYSRTIHGIYSNKVGSSFFEKSILSAYVLEGRYIDEFSIVLSNGVPIPEHKYMRWINYVLHENYSVKIRNPWLVYEQLYKDDDIKKEFQYFPWHFYLTDTIGNSGYLAVYAVQEGTDSVQKEFDKEEDTNVIQEMRSCIMQFKQNITDNEDMQVEKLIEKLRKAYAGADNKESNCPDKENEELEKFVTELYILDNSVIAVKLLSEIYGKDFWELWKQVKDVAGDIVFDVALKEKDIEPMEPLSTAGWFWTTDDDLLLLDLYTDKTEFSAEVSSWLEKLKVKFDEQMQKDVEIKNPLKWICDLLIFANDEYSKVYAFTDFWNETMDNLLDKRYIVLWKLFDDMLHDKEMLDIVDEIFISREEQEQSKPSFILYANIWEDRGRILSNQKTPRDRRNNPARVILKRYMALVANKKLRKQVFGF